MNVKKPTTSNDSMRGMKLMVFVMGIVLIAGVLVLIYAGFRKIEREKFQSVTQQKSFEVICEQPSVNISLSKGTIIPPMRFMKENIGVTLLEPNGNYTVHIYHRCTGALQHTIKFVTKPQ